MSVDEQVAPPTGPDSDLPAPGPDEAMPPVEPAAPPPDADADGGDGRRRGRTIVVGIVVAALLLVLLIVFLLPLAAQQRQQHRTDLFTEPARRFRPGQPAFVLQIPAIGLNQVVVSGSQPAELRGGPGWRQGTASPGQGNTVVLGHSTLWGSVFGQLEALPAGTAISVQTRDGRVYRYRVDRVRKVPGNRTAVMRQAGPKRLTLVTSAGGPFDTSRVVVVAGATGTSSPAVPKAYRAQVQRGKPGPFDDRPPGDAVLLLAGLVVTAIGCWGAASFAGRRNVSTIVLVAGPTIALGVVLVLFHLDALLPTTF